MDCWKFIYNSGTLFKGLKKAGEVIIYEVVSLMQKTP